MLRYTYLLTSGASPQSSALSPRIHLRPILWFLWLSSDSFSVSGVSLETAVSPQIHLEPIFWILWLPLRQLLCPHGLTLDRSSDNTRDTSYTLDLFLMWLTSYSCLCGHFRLDFNGSMHYYGFQKFPNGSYITSNAIVSFHEIWTWPMSDCSRYRKRISTTSYPVSLVLLRHALILRRKWEECAY